MKSLGDSTVAIVGLGLMGGSLALALQEYQACARLVGIDSSLEACALARTRGIDADVDLRQIAQADLIILATPVHAILGQLERVGSFARPGALVMDLGSTKREITRAMERLPDGLECIGGHPMCGKESSGFAVADSHLFRNAVFVLAPLARTSIPALALARTLAETIGARPLVLSAERHDQLVAVTSHLPYAVAITLMTTALEYEQADETLFALAASGFRDTSRLAASDTTMMGDTLLTNRNTIAAVLRTYSRHLQVLADRLADGDEVGLRTILSRAAVKRRELFK